MTIVYTDDWLTVHQGDCRDVMAGMEPESVQAVVTSPPYWGLRDYGIPPTIWGGDAAHDHEWGEPVVDHATNHTDKRRWQHTRNGRDEVFPPDKRVAWRRTDVVQGAYCECGAWAGALGLEPTPGEFVEHVVELFREVRRVLRQDGTVWLNLGDSYAATRTAQVPQTKDAGSKRAAGQFNALPMSVPPGLKAKDRVMIPARVALALQADGWWLRDEIVWSKPNPMPSSVADRTTPAHEMIYLLARSARYAYNGAAIREPLAESSVQRISQATFDQQTGGPKDYANGINPNQSARKALENVARKHRRTPAGWNVNHDEPNITGRYRQRDKQAATPIPGDAHDVVGFNDRWDESEANGTAPDGRNKRSVWTIPTAPYPEAHFATFPEKLVEPMILAGCPAGAVVLDPFAGSGTVGAVAQRLSRRAILIDLNPEYLVQALSRNRELPLGLAEDVA